jgi:hypothetical protein
LKATKKASVAAPEPNIAPTTTSLTRPSTRETSVNEPKVAIDRNKPFFIDYPLAAGDRWLGFRCAGQPFHRAASHGMHIK